MKKLLSILCLAGGLATGLHAVVPEPDNVFYGLVFTGTNQITQITAGNSAVIVEARRTPDGTALASYTMGSKRALGDFYSLRVGLESVQPVQSPQAFGTGSTVYLTVTTAGAVLGQKSLVVGPRGQITRLDFGLGNYPTDWVSHFKHPADNAPADNVVSAGELDAYTVAWRSGQVWPLDPNPIPIGYVTRAGALWLSGGSYVFDPNQVSAAPANNPAWWSTNAPLWWSKAAPASIPPGGSTVVRALPPLYQPGTPLTISETVTCAPGIGVYAVEDQPPAGWQVSNISDGGSFDPVSQKVKWGLFKDNTARVLSYTATPPAGTTGDLQFAGQGGFDGQVVTITGPDETGLAAAIASVNFLPGRGFKLTVKGSPGETQPVEVSTNLITWESLVTASFDASGLWQFTDGSSTNYTRRFYRMAIPAQ